MRWRKIFRLSGVIGAGICGACLVETKLLSHWPLGTVSATCGEPSRPKAHPPSKPPPKSSKPEPAKVEEPSPEAREIRTTLQGLKLKQVQVFFRHGARLPLSITHGVDEAWYPWDIALRTVPHTVFNHQVVVLPDKTPKEEESAMELHYQRTELLGGGYAGNMTTYGQQQVYELGVKYRDHYVRQAGLLPSYYDPEAVFVQSTDMSRTVDSIRCVLAGMFGKDSLNENGPVLIPVSMPNDEVLYPNSKACSVVRKTNHAAFVHYDHIPGIYDDRLEVEKVLGYKSAREEEEEEEEMAAASSGDHEEEEQEPDLNFMALRDDLVCRQAHGYRLPPCLAPYMGMIERNATKILYYAMTGRNTVERPVVTSLSAGPALSLAYEALKKSTGIRDPGLVTPKISLYSVHDSLMVSLLETMGLFDWKWPKFGCDLCIELYSDRKAKEHFVRVLYNGQVKTVRGCSSFICPFEEFEAAIQPYVVPRGPDFDRACGSQILEEITASLRRLNPFDEDPEELGEQCETPVCG